MGKSVSFSFKCLCNFLQYFRNINLLRTFLNTGFTFAAV
ncbi:virulence factor TspB C-terminal domain-related protein [uncultured Methanobrevibacter sp.]